MGERRAEEDLRLRRFLGGDCPGVFATDFVGDGDCDVEVLETSTALSEVVLTASVLFDCFAESEALEESEEKGRSRCCGLIGRTHQSLRTPRA